MNSEISPITPTRETSPYKGLQPFTEEDSSFFFGREQDIDIIASNLCVAKLTILYGASGAGKSSVLMAGVLPELKRISRFSVVLFREWQMGHFELALRSALLGNEKLIEKQRASGHPIDPDPGLPFDQLLANCSRAFRVSFLFIFDQFEEYLGTEHSFTHSDNGFDAQLARAINQREIRANFLLSMREDSLSKLDRFQGRVPNLLGNLLRLEHLDREAAERAIREPVHVYNQYHPHPNPIVPEAALVEEVLNQVSIGRIKMDDPRQVKTETGSPNLAVDGRIEAPYLQMVLISLWKQEMAEGSRKLRLETLERLGNAEAIVRKQFDDAMGGLEDLERDLAARLFYYLVSPTGLKISHTAVDLAILTGKPHERVKEVLKRLSSSQVRILRPVAPSPGQPDTEKYEIFHDALAPAISAWKSDYDRERERKRRDHELRKAKEEQEKAEKEKRRLKIYAVVISVLLFCIAALYLYAFLEQRVARHAENETLREKTNAASALAEVRRLDSALPHSKLVLRGHQGGVNDIKFSSDGSHVVTASEDGTARVWNVSTGQDQAPVETTLSGHTDVVISAAFSPDGRRVITASKDKTARVWNAVSGAQLAKLVGHLDVVNSAIFSPDGHLMATSSGDNTARLWNAFTSELTAELRGHTGPVINLAFSPDSKFLVTASEDNTARLWDTSTGQGLYEWRHTGVVNCAVFSPDSRFVATASGDKTAKIWASGTHQLVATLRGHTGAVNKVAFSPDGKSVVTASSDGSARVWDALDGSLQFKLQGHAGAVVSAAFATSGQRITTVSLDRTAKVWDAGTGDALLTLQGGHTDFILAAAYSLDGNVVATASADQTARIWSTSDDAPVGGFRVTDVTLEANPTSYSGECPTRVEFRGSIAVVGAGNVSYRFVRSNGASSQIQTLTFSTSGSRDVNTTWTLGSPSYPVIAGWQAIEILEPQEFRSEEANFNVQCASNSELIVPKQLSPKNAEKLDGSPKRVTLQWESVQGAVSYRIEVHYHNQATKRWEAFGVISADANGQPVNSHLLTFKSAQRGRWRVWAVDSESHTSGKSAWWQFEFKP